MNLFKPQKATKHRKGMRLSLLISLPLVWTVAYLGHLFNGGMSSIIETLSLRSEADGNLSQKPATHSKSSSNSIETLSPRLAHLEPSTNHVVMAEADSSTQTPIAHHKNSAIPREILEWTPTSSTGLTKTLCTAIPPRSRVFLDPAPILESMFDKNQAGWKFVFEQGEDACKNSLIRILWDERNQKNTMFGPVQRQQLLNHQPGQQLTTSIIGSSMDKSELFKLIQTTTAKEKKGSSSVLLLKKSILETRIFDSKESCHAFCTDESSNLQKWIWKPFYTFKGHGIHIIGDGTGSSNGGGKKEDDSSSSCHNHCDNTKDGMTQAQALAQPMLLPDGRKFDVRSHIFVASVNPLIVFSGAERTQICVEPMHNKNNSKRPFPGLPANNNATTTTLHPYQYVCNAGQKHPDWSFENNVGYLDRSITDSALRLQVQEKIDAIHVALIDLLSHRWTGKIGMFQVFGLDFAVDKDENVWLLEMNDQPGWRGAFENWRPNPWPDMLRIEWEILSFLGVGKNITPVDADIIIDDEKVKQLKERLASMELETMHMLSVGEVQQP